MAEIGEMAPRPGFEPGSLARQASILDRTILSGLTEIFNSYLFNLIGIYINGSSFIPDLKLWVFWAPIYISISMLVIHLSYIVHMQRDKK